MKSANGPESKNLRHQLEEMPPVSVIIVNLNGQDHLKDCLSSLQAINYDQQKLQIIVVDNGSTDGSKKLIKQSFPQVELIQNKSNVGFVKAINQGAKKASGDYLAFLNNDTRVHPEWLRELLMPILANPEVACVGSKMLTWDGKTIDFIDSALSFYGHGFKLHTGEPDAKTYNQEKPILFACGGAMLVDKRIYLESGGFDDDYFAFFEDVDFGWRLWLFGYKVMFAPQSIVYHRHHGTTQKYGYEKERLLLEKNALFTIIKNYEDKNLQQIFPAATLLTIKRGLTETNIARDSYNIGQPTESNSQDEPVPKLALSHFLALDDVIKEMPRLLKKRSFVQKHRKRRDSYLFTLFKQPFRPNISDTSYQEAQETITKAFNIDKLINSRNKILIISNDTVAKKMAGPAIRCWEFAKALSNQQEVVLAIPNETNLTSPDFIIETYNERKLKKLVKWCDVIICQGFILHHFPFLKKVTKPIVVDIYCPFTLEMLELFKYKKYDDRLNIHTNNLEVLNDQLLVGDFFLCASEKQRDFWIGMLTSLNRINPSTYDPDKTLKKFIDIVPFGLPSVPPRHTKDVLKGVYKTVKKKDKVILWGGGIYNWFDPITLIKAINNIAEQRDDIKLFFMGLDHPNPDVPEMKMCLDAIQLSKELDLYDKYVIFNFSWVPYEERQNYLLESDIGISTHLEHVETQFSFRTRLLDYIWAQLPVIATRGDSMSELVEKYNLGKTIEPGDVDQLTKAILELVDQGELTKTFRRNLKKIAPSLTWENVTSPLKAYCRDPRIAPDKLIDEDSRLSVPTHGIISKQKTTRKSPFYYLGRTVHHYQNQGVKGIWFHGKNFIRRQSEPRK